MPVYTSFFYCPNSNLRAPSHTSDTPCHCFYGKRGYSTLFGKYGSSHLLSHKGGTQTVLSSCPTEAAAEANTPFLTDITAHLPHNQTPSLFSEQERFQQVFDTEHLQLNWGKEDK